MASEIRVRLGIGKLESIKELRFADEVRIATDNYNDVAYVPAEIREEFRSSNAAGDVLLVLHDWHIWDEEEEQKPWSERAGNVVPILDVWESINYVGHDPSEFLRGGLELGPHMFKRLGSYREFFGLLKKPPNVLKRAFDGEPFIVVKPMIADAILDELDTELRLPKVNNKSGIWNQRSIVLAAENANKLTRQVWEYIKMKGIAKIRQEEIATLSKAFDNVGGYKLSIYLALKLLEHQGKALWIDPEKAFIVPEVNEKKESQRLDAEKTSTAKMFCRYCGAENFQDARFCQKCGKAMGKPT